MSARSERMARHRQRTGQLRIGERRAVQAGLSDADLSKDYAHIQAKLAAKRQTIRALEAKVKRLESALRAGLTWDEHKANEAARDRDRGERHLHDASDGAA